jgi:hypothetical protein
VRGPSSKRAENERQAREGGEAVPPKKKSVKDKPPMLKRIGSALFGDKKAAKKPTPAQLRAKKGAYLRRERQAVELAGTPNPIHH